MDTEVAIGARRYAINWDRSVRHRSVAHGRVTDDSDGLAIGLGATITVDDPLIRAVISADRYALNGDSDVVFADGLAHNVTVNIAAPGYRSVTTTIAIPAGAVAPVITDIALRRLPVTVEGRVFGRTIAAPPTFTPLAGATIEITGPIGPGGEVPLLLRQPLVEDLRAGDDVRARSLTPSANVAVTALAVPGQGAIALADGTSAAAGELLRIGPVHAPTWVEIASLTPDPARPAPAVLAWLTVPLATVVMAGQVLGRFAKGAFVGPVLTPIGAAYAGEVLLFVDVAAANAGDILVVRSPGQPDRYHDRGAVTSPGGDYRLPGLARTAIPALRVTAGGFSTQTQTYRLARIATSPVDWRLIP